MKTVKAASVEIRMIGGNVVATRKTNFDRVNIAEKSLVMHRLFLAASQLAEDYNMRNEFETLCREFKYAIPDAA